MATPVTTAQVVPANKIMGLKELKKLCKGGRQGNWGNPNRKALKRLEQRQADFDKVKGVQENSFHRPGSMKVY